MQLDNSWPWYLDSEGDLYQLKEGRWYAHQIVKRRHILLTYDIKRTRCNTLNVVMRASIYQKGQRLICSRAGPILTPTTNISSTFEVYLMADEKIRWCLHKLHMMSTHEVARAIREGTARAVCVGSFKTTYGTAAWTI